MAKEDFCFTYYDGDATRDMSHLTRLQRGAYSDIVSLMIRNGRLHFDEIKFCLGEDFKKCWPAIEMLMDKDDQKMYFIPWVDKSLGGKAAKKFEVTYLYFLVLSTGVEQFIKIGISNNPKKRYKDYGREGFSVVELKTIEFQSRGDAEYSEQQEHSRYLTYRYSPTRRFPGCTECFHMDALKLILNG